MTPISFLRSWPLRRWAVAALATVGYVLLVGIPTDLIDTPLFGRDVPPTWWSWPALLVSAALAGLLTATYVKVPDPDPTPEPAATPEPPRPVTRAGYAGGLLTFFAVGCPVCNKLVLLAFGYAGAMAWFQPVQPVLQALALALLGWALWRRLRTQTSCPLTRPQGGTVG